MWPVVSRPSQVAFNSHQLDRQLRDRGGLLLLRSRPRLAFAGMAFFVVLASTSSFMPILDLSVEHRMYLQPDSVTDIAWLAWLRATAPDTQDRNGVAAVELAKQAVNAAGYKDVAALNILAAAYAESGQFGEAITTGRRALGQARALRDEHLIAKTEQRLSEFLEHRPLRQRQFDSIEP